MLCFLLYHVGNEGNKLFVFVFVYEEMRKYFPINEEAVSHTVYDFATAPF